MGAFAPYGYKKSPENKNQLIVDEAVSEYVQMIFAMYKDGFSIGRIAARLNQMGVLSPMEYKHSAGVKFDTVFKTGDTAKWTYKAVQRILINEVYIGVLAQGKRGTPNYKVRVVQSKDETEWVKVENAHEALVSYEDFMAVKTMMKRDMRCSPDQDEAHLFSGFLFCGDCQQSMIRKTVPSKTKKYIYYVCSENKHSRTCSPHSISAKEVEEKVFRAIHDQIELVINLEKALEMIERLPSQSRKAFNYEAQIAKIEEEIERYQKLKLRLYEDLSDGIIDKAEYFEFRNSYTKIIEDMVPEATDTVQRIFQLFLSGMTLMPISRVLNQEERKTPAQLQMELYGKKKSDVRQFLWSYTSVKNILQDESYVGVLYNHQQEIKDGKRIRYVPQAEWFRHEGVFPPIISGADWDQAQALLQKQCRKREKSNAPCHRYAGLLTCSECGAPFVAINRYWNGNCRVEYICKSYMRYGKNTCSSHRIREEVLDQMVQEYAEVMRKQYTEELKKLAQIQKMWALRKPILDAHGLSLQEKVLELEQEIDEIVMEKIATPHRPQ